MKFQSIKLFFILSCFYHQFPKRVFKFNENANQSELSSITLENKPQEILPEHFIICSTHNQEKFNTPDTHTWYVLYWDENFEIPWFSIGFWAHGTLWANLKNTYWYQISTLPTELIDDWITICVEINSLNRTIRTSIEGDSFQTTEKVEGLEERPKMNLRLGIVDVKYHQHEFLQFHGKIAELSFFHGINLNISDMSHNICEFTTEKTLLKWENMVWNVVGKNVVETNISDSIICPNSNFINLRMPLKWTKASGSTVCNKYGKIFEFDNIEDIDNINMEHIFGDKYSECNWFWTPYIYKAGEVVSQYDGHIVRSVLFVFKISLISILISLKPLKSHQNFRTFLNLSTQNSKKFF